MAASANRSASPSWAEECRANLRRSSPKLAFDSQNQVSAVLALECLWPMHLRLQVPSLHHGLLTEHCENSWASWAAVASWSVTAKLEELLRSHQSSLPATPTEESAQNDKKKYCNLTGTRPKERKTRKPIKRATQTLQASGRMLSAKDPFEEGRSTAFHQMTQY